MLRLAPAAAAAALLFAGPSVSAQTVSTPPANPAPANPPPAIPGEITTTRPAADRLFSSPAPGRASTQTSRPHAPSPAIARPRTAAPAALAPRPGFRFTETKPSDLRISGHTLRLTDLPGDASAEFIFPAQPRPAQLATALTPLQVPDPRLGWLAHCINQPLTGRAESSLSISPGPRTADSPTLRLETGLAAAR